MTSLDPAPRLEDWEIRRRGCVSQSHGPERTVTDQPDPDFIRRPVGFAPPEESE